MLNRLLNFDVYALNRNSGMAMGTLVLAVTATIDYATPVDISVTAFYLFSVLIVGWNCGRAWAFAFAMVAFSTQFGLAVLQNSFHGRIVYFTFANANRLFTFALVVHLTTRLRALYDRETRTARVDDLTCVKNRKGFREMLDAEIIRHRRSGKSLCALYIDCDDFKIINDRFGHGEGDLLLTTIAAVATRSVRRTDTVGRLGGDEFAVIFPETKPCDSLRVAAKLHEALGKIALNKRWPVSFSFGVGCFVMMPPSADEAMKFADSVMYQAKSAGKNRIFWANFGDRGPASDASLVQPPRPLGR